MFDILEAGISDIRAALERGEVTTRELVLRYMERIAKIDKCEGGINAVLQLNPDALFIADRLDSMRKKGQILGTLHGVPMLIKANINTADNMTTSAGSVTLRHSYAPEDAHIVSLLRGAGALILGKTNMTEFANFMTQNMKNGYSSLGGQVLCPFDREGDVSGSSSGSGAAVSANLCAAAIGTETGGSIISPSMNNGIVGLKPTMGLVSRSGIIPISSTCDIAGPMARSVSDVATILSIIADEDMRDASTQNDNIPFIVYEDSLEEFPLKGARIGINRAYSDKASEARLRETESLIETLQDAGAQIIELDDIMWTDKAFDIMLYEFKNAINAYLASLGANRTVNNLEEIIAYNNEHADIALKYGQTILFNAQYKTGGGLSEATYIKAILEREEKTKLLNKVFDEHGLDMILCVYYSNLPPFTGFPALTLPIGYDEKGRPIGSYFFAKPFEEAKLLGLSYAIEQLTKARTNPIKED